MDIFRREESNSGMVMFGIVPVEKVLAEGSAVRGTPEPFRKIDNQTTTESTTSYPMT